MQTTPAPVTNFGGNQSFTPAAMYVPGSEAELLEILRSHRGRRIRAIGRLHSWSAAPVCDDVLIDVRRLDAVVVHAESESSWAELGAGCQIKRVVSELARQGGFTLPTLGLINEQTIAGATATGTHGSGRHSLSHYLPAVRVATYDPATGEPVLRTIDGGAELQAARCSLGCLGVVTSVRVPIRRRYFIEEHFRRYDRLEQVLEQESAYPLQQFYLVPWNWSYFAQHRRESERSRSWLAPLYRLYWSLGMDVGLHAVVSLLARRLPDWCTPAFFRWCVPALIPRRWRVVDHSDRQLTMEHELFRHIEIELFVTRSRLAEAAGYLTWLLKHLAGEQAELAAPLRERLQTAGCWPELEAARGSYRHHYPICIRKVLADDTLISMASGDGEPYYALSCISYARPERREGFFRFADLFARTAARLFDARPHWGKYCPLPAAELRRLYPRMESFIREIRRAGTFPAFENRWMSELFGGED